MAASLFMDATALTTSMAAMVLTIFTAASPLYRAVTAAWRCRSAEGVHGRGKEEGERGEGSGRERGAEEEEGERGREREVERCRSEQKGRGGEREGRRREGKKVVIPRVKEEE
eukprot:3941706-Rhodomonas_salina.2